jgi:hypothetical protein
MDRPSVSSNSHFIFGGGFKKSMTSKKMTSAGLRWSITWKGCFICTVRSDSSQVL